MKRNILRFINTHQHLLNLFAKEMLKNTITYFRWKYLIDELRASFERLGNALDSGGDGRFKDCMMAHIHKLEAARFNEVWDVGIDVIQTGTELMVQLNDYVPIIKK